MLVKGASFELMGENSYLIVDEKTNRSALVDCNTYDDKMRELIGDTDLEYVLLTHGHFDHIGGTRAVKENYGAKVVISKKDAPMLNSAKLSLAVFCGAPQNNVAPDILISDGDEIELGDLKIKVISTPGHTEGSICLFLDSSLTERLDAKPVLIAGDTLFFGSIGRTDFSGGSMSAMRKSLKRLAVLPDDTVVLPGHGNLTTIGGERRRVFAFYA